MQNYPFRPAGSLLAPKLIFKFLCATLMVSLVDGDVNFTKTHTRVLKLKKQSLKPSNRHKKSFWSQDGIHGLNLHACRLFQRGRPYLSHLEQT